MVGKAVLPGARSGGLPETAGAPLLLLALNSAWNVRNFRMELIRSLQEAGYRIAVAAPPGDELSSLSADGIEVCPVPIRPSGTSPVQDALLTARYFRLIGKLRPFAFLGFTPKPNIYGSIAAHLRGVPVINNVTGLGTAFIHGSLLERLVTLLYRLALRRSKAVFFHNPDDRTLFISRRLVAEDRARVIPGSGIDTLRFAPEPLQSGGKGPIFLFVGRLLREKGIGEYVEAARAVRTSHPDARFRIIGAPADDDRGVPAALLSKWQDEGVIDYSGTCSDIRPHIAAADCVVLPSYREGLPRVLLEAGAMARPVIATDVPGCRHLVVDGRTGLLCEARSAGSLARAMVRMVELGQEERVAMGRRGRRLIEEQYSIERVSEEYLATLNRICQAGSGD